MRFQTPVLWLAACVIRPVLFSTLYVFTGLTQWLEILNRSLQQI